MTVRSVGLRTFALPAAVLALAILGTLGYVALSKPAATASPPEVPPSPVVGVVVFIDEKSLGEISSFNLLTPDGKTVSLTMGVLDNAVQFSPSHLATHMATGVPIRAFYRLQNGLPTVYHLEDAVPASPAPSPT